MAEMSQISLLPGDGIGLGDAPAERADFRPREWLALCPPALPPLDVLSEDAVGAKPWLVDDPAAALRAAEPVDTAATVAAFAGHQLAQLVVAAGLGLTAPSWLHFPDHVCTFAAALGLAATSFALNDGRFATPQLAAGLAAAALLFLSIIAYYLLYFIRLGNPGDTNSPDSFGLTPLVRWEQLVRDGPSQLVCHKDGDRLCPCPRTSCAGNAPRWAAFHALLAVGTNIASYWAFHILLAATPLFTFGSRLLAGWWGILVVVLWAPLLASYLSLALVLFRQPNFAVADLEMRLQRRATSLALASLLEGYRAALAGDGTSVSSAGPGEQHLYIRLHYRLAALWLSRNSLGFQVAHHSFNATVPVGLLLALVVTVAAGGCISAWQLAAGAFVLVWETNTLSGFAALNEELGAISAVYRAARREIGVLVSDAVAAGAEQGLVRGLEVHDRVLGTFLETDDLRALFFGFPISYGLLRTYVATAVTLAIGAWTVLRTLGVYITFQTFCPAV